MFIGRHNELKYLNDKYASDKAELVVLYGRRRIGKTETLSEFFRGKSGIFFSCRQCANSVQLSAFSDALFSLDIPAKKYISAFKDWNDAFSALGEIQSNEKTVIIIDEFPYMCKQDASIPSVLQNLWDHKLCHANIMLVLCGSSLSFIEDELLASQNPLYGRATGIYKMAPLPFDDVKEFCPAYSTEDKILLYAILGGIPHYLKQFNYSVSLEENIKREILTKGTVLYNEVEFLLHQELRETSIYNTVIEAIALGNTAFNQIYLKTQVDKTKLSVYLRNLIKLGIVKREFSALSGQKEQAGQSGGEYHLTDSFFRFWYAFAYGNYSELEDGAVERTWKKYISPYLHHFASKAFENICIDYLKRQNRADALPFDASSIGRWWGKVTHTDEQGKKVTASEEIDIVATDSRRENYIVGECKFTNRPFDLGQFQALCRKHDFQGNIYYYLFSLNGFTETLRNEVSGMENVTLVTAEDIVG